MESSSSQPTNTTRFESSPLRYMPQLDGLRMIAVFAVLWTHYLPKDYWLFGIYWGEFGVQLFFVLSGFLITGILLKCRNLISSGQSPLLTLRQFYVRRFLRLFPLYYVILIVMFLVGMPEVRQTIIWHLFYLSNIYFSIINDFYHSVSHLWSLAVEEQFYLIWPVVILFLPRKFLLPAIVLTIAIAPLLRLAAIVFNFNEVAVWVLTPFQLDTLGMGALLAYLLYQRHTSLSFSRQNITRLFLFIGVLTLILLRILKHYVLYEVLNTTAVALTLTGLVAAAAFGFKGFTGKLLENRLIVYLGKISYGIYLIHNFMPYFVRQWVGVLGLSDSCSILVVALLSTLTTVGFAVLSWHYLEKPLNRFKKNFPYSQKSLGDV